MAKYVGTSMKRREDPRFIQGRGSYVANLTLPGMAYMAIKRSPYAHARIKSIKTSKAASYPGVVAVFTGKDMADIGNLPSGWNVPGIKVPVQKVLQSDKVRHVGDRVAVVVAESPYIAADALELIEVDYEPLPAVTNPKAAMEKGAPVVHDEIADNVSYYWPIGNKDDVEKALASADKVIEIELVNQRLVATAMEPRAAVAQWDNFKGEMTLWTTSQNPNLTRVVLSAFLLGIPEHKLRLISPDVGGGFGSKIPTYPEEAMVPWVARKLGRPVKWVSTRSEAALSDTQGRDHVTTCRLGVKKDGTITGLYVSTWANNGAYISLVAALIPTALYLTVLSGLYKIPAIYGETWGTLTNTVWVDAYRGAGRPEASYVVERLVENAARELGMDPVEFRRKNFIPASEFPYQTPVAFMYDSGDYQRLMDKAVELADYKAMRAAQAEARKQGRLVGIGIAASIEASGPAPSKVAGALGGVTGFWESGSIRVHATGRVTALTGAHSHGQGHETTMAQIVADELGVDINDVELVHGDTAVIPNAMGTYGSRSTSVGGSALVRSAQKIRAKLIKIAAHQMEAAVEDLVYDQAAGKVHVKGSPDKAKAFGELAFAAYTAHNLPNDVEPGLEEDAYYDPANFTFPNSVHMAMVEVDRDTGATTILKYVAVDDVGKVINPLIVEGQVVGGIVQGVGQALTEHGAYTADGQLIASTLMEYAVPHASLFPNIESGRTETPSPHNPLGVKGVGEMGTITSTPTIANAVIDAVSPLGIKHIDMPLTAAAVWKAMQK
ncbi:MAG: xanthine dehydrogenase family protein molybdopterin-binding subunit [Anaerolineales bacterium]